MNKLSDFFESISDFIDDLPLWFKVSSISVVLVSASAFFQLDDLLDYHKSMRLIEEQKQSMGFGEYLYSEVGCQYYVDYAYDEEVDVALYEGMVVFADSEVNGAGFMIPEGSVICSHHQIGLVKNVELFYDFQSVTGSIYAKGSIIPLVAEVYTLPRDTLPKSLVINLPKANATAITHLH